MDSQQHSDTDYDQLEKDLRAHFEASWKTLLTRQVGPTRQILRKVFNGNRLPFLPMTNESGSQYEFKGTASIGRLLAGRAKALVSPTGADALWLSAIIPNQFAETLQEAVAVNVLGV